MRLRGRGSCVGPLLVGAAGKGRARQRGRAGLFYNKEPGAWMVPGWPGWRMGPGKQKGLFRPGLGRSERWRRRRKPGAGVTFCGGRRGSPPRSEQRAKKKKPGCGVDLSRRRWAVVWVPGMRRAFFVAEAGGRRGLRACGGSFCGGGKRGVWTCSGPFPVGWRGLRGCCGPFCGGLVRALPSLPLLRAAGGGGRRGPGASRRSRCPKAGRAPAVCPARRSPAPAPSPARGRRGAWPRR